MTTQYIDRTEFKKAIKKAFYKHNVGSHKDCAWFVIEAEVDDLCNLAEELMRARNVDED